MRCANVDWAAWGIKYLQSRTNLSYLIAFSSHVSINSAGNGLVLVVADLQYRLRSLVLPAKTLLRAATTITTTTTTTITTASTTAQPESSRLGSSNSEQHIFNSQTPCLSTTCAHHRAHSPCSAQKMINLGLSRISRLLSLSTTPRTWKAVHIAGTNGKGSVAALLSSLLRRLSTPLVSTNSADSTNNDSARNEIRIGRFTSPHLIDRWDCITINDKPIAESTFLRVESDVKSLADIVNAEVSSRKSDSSGEKKDSGVTEFELLTATAFEIFSREKCQLAVVECGLGGRLDATNALKDDEVALSVITSISLDHVGLLGDTVEAIAEQKAGIAKSGVHMLVDANNLDGVVESITRTAKGKNVASVQFSKRSDLRSWGFGREQCDATSEPVVLSLSIDDQEDEMRTQVLMPHQIDNICTAISAFNLLISSQDTIGMSVRLSTPRSLPETLASVLRDVSHSYQGRLQHLSIRSLYPNYTPEILLDGAHNLQSAVALKAYVDTLMSTSPCSPLSPSISPSSSQPTDTSYSDQSRKATNNIITSITWIVALSQGKDPVPILSAMTEGTNSTKLDTNGSDEKNNASVPTRVIFTSFSPVDGMPWISSQDPHELKRVIEQYLFASTRDEGSNHDDSKKFQSGYKITSNPDSNLESDQSRITSNPVSKPVSIYTTNNIIEALELATTPDFKLRSTSLTNSHTPEHTFTDNNANKTQDPNENALIVVAGSLYLVSDLLRFLRDGKETLRPRFH